MRNIVVFILLLIVLALGLSIGYFYSHKSSSSHNIVPSHSPTVSYCNGENLKASLELSPAAGNVYGTFTLKNISNAPCQVLGGNFVQVNYPSSVKNIQVIHQGQTQKQPFNLLPGQTLYSQVHYPNGPQCQSETVQIPVSFTYKISPSSIITFKSPLQNIPLVIQDCSPLNQQTQIQIWQMSDQPIAN